MSHQLSMPDVPPPEALVSHAELLQRLAPLLPASMRKTLENIASIPIEMRFVDPPDLLDPNPPLKAATQHIWVKVKQRLNDSPHVHRASAAYFSDHALLATALRPHGVNFPSPKLGAMASLDHSMWFHSSSFRADEWMLYSMHSPWAGNGR
mmetsp:Transcript_44122/g.101985  ORF Transcript_44122/g.101985 Transcript_44122/m.101985 type:complete len:151 (+) Transcript_44122:538-990(+)